jgi:hypothetical protein
MPVKSSGFDGRKVVDDAMRKVVEAAAARGRAIACTQHGTRATVTVQRDGGKYKLAIDGACCEDLLARIDAAVAS